MVVQPEMLDMSTGSTNQHLEGFVQCYEKAACCSTKWLLAMMFLFHLIKTISVLLIS